MDTCIYGVRWNGPPGFGAPRVFSSSSPLTSGWAAASSDAAVTLGSDLTAAPNNIVECTNTETNRGCLEVQNMLPGRELAAPFSGVIVRWHVRVGSFTEAQAIRIRVVHPVAPQEFKVKSSSSFESVPEGEGTYTFPASVPIASGDRVGLEGDSGKEIQAEGTPAGAESFLFNIALATDETGPRSSPPSSTGRSS